MAAPHPGDIVAITDGTRRARLAIGATELTGEARKWIQAVIQPLPNESTLRAVKETSRGRRLGEWRIDVIQAELEIVNECVAQR